MSIMHRVGESNRRRRRDEIFCTRENCTVCPGSSDPFYLVSYYIKWVTTSWTYSMNMGLNL